MQITIQVSGLDQLARKLGTIATDAVLSVPLKRAQDRIIERLQEYPPELPGQTYVRTYQLHDGWIGLSPESGAGTLTAAIQNDVAYAPYVQRDVTLPAPHQAGIHEGRWQTDVQVVEELKDEIEADFVRAVQIALNK